MSSSICATTVEFHASDFLKDEVVKKIGEAKIVVILDAFEETGQLEKFLTKKVLKYLEDVIILSCTLIKIQSLKDFTSFKPCRNAPQIINIEHFQNPHSSRLILYRHYSTGRFKLLNPFYNLKDFFCSFESLVQHYLFKLHLNNLLNIKINTNEFFDGKRLIDHAVGNSDILYIKFLKLFGVDLEIINERKKRPLEIAVENGNVEAFLALLDLKSLSELTEIKDNKIIRLMSLIQEGTGFNLLMIAIKSGCKEIYLKSGCKEIAKFMLAHQFVDINYESNGVSAASLAIGNKDFEVLHMLLQNNAKIPPNFNATNCPKYVKNFVEETTKVHVHIAKNDLQEVKKIIRKYPNLRHFYNLKGESAVATAVELQNMEMYELLISNGITLSSDEDIQTLIHKDDDVLKCKVQKAIRNNLKLPYEPHITRLLEHSRVGHDVPDSLKQKYSQLILDAVQQLSSAQEIDILFQVVTTADFLKLIFEFNRDTVDQIDPKTDRSTLGVTYLSGWIYIGTKGLKVGSTKEEKDTALGTIAHEICHYAMHLTYNNHAKPYKENHAVKKVEFQAIVQEYERMYIEKILEEEIISRVFECYDKPSWCAELIVRVPEICAFYMNNSTKFNDLRQKHHKLFSYYYMIMDDMKQLVSGHSAMKTIKLINDVVGVEQEILNASEKTILRKNFEHPMIENSSTCKVIKSNCPILTAKHIIISSDTKTTIWVKKESLKIDKICELVKEVYNHDKIKPKLVVLCDDDFSNVEVNNLIKTYKDNLMFIVNDEFKLEPVEILTYQVEYKFSDLTKESKKQFNNNIVLFQGIDVRLREVFIDPSAEDELPLRQLLNKVKIIIGKTPQEPGKFYYEREFEKDSENPKLFHDIIDERILLLSDEPGMGKSTTFKNAALQIKQEFPLKWVLFVDLKLYFSSYKKFKNVEHWTEEGIVDLFAHMFKFNKLDRAAFNGKLCSKQATLLFDGVDEISPDYKEFIIKLIHQVYTLTSNQIWIASRPHCVREIKDILNIKCYKLSTIDQDQFIEFFFKETQTSTEEQFIISKCIDKMRADWNEEYNNPLLIMIAVQIHKELDGDDNLYTFYEKFVNKKYEIIIRDQYNVFDENLGKGKLREDDFIGMRGKVDHFHEKMAINLLLDKIKNQKFKFDKLEIFNLCNSDVGIDAIFGMGILYGDSYEDCFFVHLTLAEFFTSKFLVQNVIERISCDDGEKKLRLEFFWTILVDENNKQIQRFIEYFLQKNTVKTENLSVCAHFNTKIDEYCDKFKDTLQDIPLEHSKCYFFHHIFMHLVVYKFDKTIEFLKNVCKIDHTEISVSDQSTSSLHAVNWQFTLNFFGQDLGKKMLISLLSSTDSEMKISTFSNAINNFYGENLSNFFCILNDTFDSSELSQILIQNNDLKSSVSSYIEIMSSSTSKSLDDFKEFLNFIDRNFNNEIKNAIILAIKHFDQNVDIFAQLISSFKNPLTIANLREVIFEYIGNFEKPSELIAIWNKDFIHMLNEKDYRSEVLLYFFEHLNKISQKHFVRPNVSYDWLLSDALKENTKLLISVVSNSEMAKLMNYDEKSFLNDILMILKEYIEIHYFKEGAGNDLNVYVNLFKFLLLVLPDLNDTIIKNCFDFAEENPEKIHRKFEIVWNIFGSLNHSNKVKVLKEFLTNIQEINLELLSLLWKILKDFLSDESLILMFLFLKKHYANTYEYPIINLELKYIKPKEFSEFINGCGHMIQYENLESLFDCIKFSFFDISSSEGTLIENFSNLMLFLKSKFTTKEIDNRLLTLAKDFIKIKGSGNKYVDLMFLKYTINASILGELTVKNFFGNFLNDASIISGITNFLDSTKTIEIYERLKKNYLSYSKGEKFENLSQYEKINGVKIELTIFYQRIDYQIYDSLTKGLCKGEELQSLITKTIEKNKQMEFLISGSDDECGWNKIQQSVLQQVKSKKFELKFRDGFKEIGIKSALMQPNRKLNGRTLLMEILQYGIIPRNSVYNIFCSIFSFMPLKEQERFLQQPDLSGKNALQLLTSMIDIEDQEYLKKLLPKSSSSQ